MSIRYFQIKDYTIVPVIDDLQYKFTKATRNHASGGFNGLLEINDGPEAKALADVASDYGIWEIDEASAIVVAQKKRKATINIVNMNSQESQRNVSPVEDEPKADAPQDAVNSVEELLSEPDAEVIVESAKEPAPKTAKKATRKPRKSSK